MWRSDSRVHLRGLTLKVDDDHWTCHKHILSFLLCHQTQEVQKAMDEKRFDEAVRLRGRFFFFNHSAVTSLNIC